MNNPVAADNKSQPLSACIISGLLTISIGVDTLAFATNNNGDPEGFNVTNPERFAEDVLRELHREDEDGTTIVHTMFDEAAYMAADQGSEWTRER